MRGEDDRNRPSQGAVPGSPQHARGRRRPDDPAQRARRITPACAGKTYRPIYLFAGRADHPRMRGENIQFPLLLGSHIGSPPHARGKRRFRLRRPPHARITPACAVKTAIIFDASDSYSDHPRMRGENDGWLDNQPKITGSPPHARGKLIQGAANLLSFKDHPRMRGEDGAHFLYEKKLKGSPPHARGRLEHILPPTKLVRITPACAGKTRRGLRLPSRSADHPRMRGEDLMSTPATPFRRGSPPHARGRLVFSSALPCVRGITPACAGKTLTALSNRLGRGDHPRMRGEDS